MGLWDAATYVPRTILGGISTAASTAWNAGTYVPRKLYGGATTALSYANPWAYGQTTPETGQAPATGVPFAEPETAPQQSSRWGGWFGRTTAPTAGAPTELKSLKAMEQDEGKTMKTRGILKRKDDETVPATKEPMMRPVKSATDLLWYGAQSLNPSYWYGLRSITPNCFRSDKPYTLTKGQSNSPYTEEKKTENMNSDERTEVTYGHTKANAGTPRSKILERLKKEKLQSDYGLHTPGAFPDDTIESMNRSTNDSTLKSIIHRFANKFYFDRKAKEGTETTMWTAEDRKWLFDQVDQALKTALAPINRLRQATRDNFSRAGTEITNLTSAAKQAASSYMPKRTRFAL